MVHQMRTRLVTSQRNHLAGGLLRITTRRPDEGFSRLMGIAHTDARTRFVIADRPQTIVWAFTVSSRTSIWRFMAIWPSVESLFSITPLP